MYARMITLDFGSGNEAVAGKIAEKMMPAYQSLDGFVSATFLGNDDTGEYVSITFWSSEEAGEAAAAALAGPAQAALADVVKAPPVMRQYVVYEPEV